MYKLRSEAANRGTVIKFLPPNFVKRKSNSTQVNFSSKVIFWHIEWIFFNADNLKFTDTKVPETEKLGSVLTKHLVKHEDNVLQEKLQFYQSCNLSGISLLLKAEERSGKKFYELDSSASLKENFKGKVIIEYPTIYVILKHHANSFDIIDSDDEDGDGNADHKPGSDVVEKIIKKAEKDENLYKSLKNLLFISEYSDGELSQED